MGTEYLNAGHHVVQFYSHDEELAERVVGYLLEALGGGGVAVVIATPEHRREFEDRLRNAGADLTAARDSGTYLVLDASKTVRELMPVGRLDLVAFDRVIGGLIRQAGTGGRPVRAYGEMVALLWDDGLVNAAIQLETMWEELGRTHSFSLFCGYPAGRRPATVIWMLSLRCAACTGRWSASHPPRLPGPAGPQRCGLIPSLATRPPRPVTSPSACCATGRPGTSPMTPPWW